MNTKPANSTGYGSTSCSYPWASDPWGKPDSDELMECAHCGAAFTPSGRGKNIYCSPGCRKLATNEHAKLGARLEAGPAILDPYTALAVNVVLESLRDLKSPDPIKGLDSLLFWLSGAGATWLFALGFEAGADPDQAFLYALRGARNDREPRSQ